MMHAASHKFGLPLENYLDGQLTGSDQVAFERRIGSDRALRAEVERQQSIDASIRRTLDPPNDAELIAMMAQIQLASSPRSSNRRQHHRELTFAALHIPASLRPLALAASLALAVLGGWMVWNAAPGWLVPGHNPYATQPWRSMNAVYHDKIADGMEPDWICDNDAEFQRAFWERFRQPLLLEKLPPNHAAVGLAYSNTISTRTAVLLAKVEGEPVLVFVDRLVNDSPELPYNAEDLNVFRREVEDLVLYEMSHFDEPRMLPYFYDPEKGIRQ